MAFPVGWERVAAITIDHTQIGSMLSDWPLLCSEANLPSEMFDADGAYPAQNGGGDIRFTTDRDGTTQIPCEVVDFTTNNDPANGTSQIWTQVPTVSAVVDTTVYVWYHTASTESQPAASDTYGSQAVWNDDYVLVMHLEQDPSTTNQYDSVTDANIGTSAGSMTSDDLVDAQVGKGLEFDGIDDYISVDLSAHDGDPEATFETIVKRNGSNTPVSDTLTGFADIGTAGSNGNSHYPWTDGSVYMGLFCDNNRPINGYADSVFDKTVLHHFALTSQNGAGNYRWYRNGSLVTSGTGPSTVLYGTILLGRSESFYSFLGVFDGVRISSVARSAAYLAANYAAIFNIASFAPSGTPEDATGGLTISPGAASCAAATVAPAIILGDITNTPNPAAAAAATVAPDVVLGDLAHTPAPAAAAAATIAPTVVLGATSLTPSPASASAATTGPTVQTGGLAITPAAAAAAAQTVAPTVIQGDVTAAPAAASAACHVGQPNVVGGAESRPTEIVFAKARDRRAKTDRRRHIESRARNRRIATRS